jgi:predicted GNAT superfamily acetyltransferase
VSAVAPRPGLSEFVFRRLTKPEEFRSAEEVAETVGVPVGEEPLPTPVLRTIQDNGGLVLGAFADIHLAGFSAAYLGWDGTTLYLYSQLTAVRPEYQNHHVGRRLKLRQREEALALGLGEIRWAFDPLQSHQAFLFVRRLGAVPDRYFVHYYGRGRSTEEVAVPSDRLRATWRLGDPAVEARLAGSGPSREDDLAAWRASKPILETQVGEHGLRAPVVVEEPTAPKVSIEVPFDLALLREHEPDSIRPWRFAVRDAFRAAFDLGYGVQGFAVVSEAHERRAVYLLAPRPMATPPASPAPPAGPDVKGG